MQIKKPMHFPHRSFQEVWDDRSEWYVVRFSFSTLPPKTLFVILHFSLAPIVAAIFLHHLLPSPI
ncbi:hypothetical protein LXL04_030097 [Taraxacum kok-saghyz]